MREDQGLVRSLRRGSTEAFGKVYEKYKNELLALALSLARDQGRAEDALHDAFVGLARTAPRLKPDTHLRAYLAAAVVNCVRNQFRAGKRETLTADPVEPLGPPVDTPDRHSAMADDLRCVDDALARLPQPQQEVINLHLLHGLRFREIAVHLDLSINTVQSRYRYGLDKLRSTLTEVMGHETASTC